MAHNSGSGGGSIKRKTKKKNKKKKTKINRKKKSKKKKTRRKTKNKRTQKRKKTNKRFKNNRRNKRQIAGMFRKDCGREFESLRDQNTNLSETLKELTQKYGQCINENEELMRKAGVRKLTDAEQKVKQRYSKSLLFSDAPRGEGETFLNEENKLITIIDGQEVDVSKSDDTRAAILPFKKKYEEVRGKRIADQRKREEAIHQNRVDKITALREKIEQKKKQEEDNSLSI